MSEKTPAAPAPTWPEFQFWIGSHVFTFYRGGHRPGDWGWKWEKGPTFTIGEGHGQGAEATIRDLFRRVADIFDHYEKLVREKTMRMLDEAKPPALPAEPARGPADDPYANPIGGRYVEPAAPSSVTPPVCPCQGEDDDPGPHIASCKYADPNHADEDDNPFGGDAAPSVTGEERDGASLIAAERKRQVEWKGWTAIHDDEEHPYGDLRVVAAMLAVQGTDAHVKDELGRTPWGLDKKHAHDDIRRLTIAGALIAAEIDRLQRRKP